MSSGEPPVDDEDTGPLNVSRPSSHVDSGSELDRGPDYSDAPELPAASRSYAPWPGHNYSSLNFTPLPLRRSRRPIILRAAAAVAVVTVVGGLAFWLLRPSPDAADTPSADPTTTSETAPRDAEAQERLLRLLPTGYPTGSCKPVDPPDGALARVGCAKNSDRNGPPSATYTLLRDKTSLRAAFEDVVRASDVVNCPGNIQSPGAWRRNAAPQQTSGMLVCGLQQNRPTVAWTTDADLLLSAVHTDPAGPNLDQLYAWWSTHS
jgi:hypothetical protein